MWLYVPTPPSAPESAGSICRCGSPCPEPSAFCTVSGKLTLRPLSSSVWRTRPWITRLSAIRCRTSALNGVDAWISSWPASRASLTQSRELGRVTKTNAPSGPNSATSSNESNPLPSFLKTYQSSFDGFDLSERDWKLWVTQLRSRCSSLRRMLAQATGASGYSSWPTAQAYNERGSRASYCEAHSQAGDDLKTIAENWPTSNAADGERTSATMMRGNPTLNGATQSWPTARSEDAESCGNHPHATDSLTGTAELWSTPDAQAMNDGETPESFENRRQTQKALGRNGNGMGTPLAVQASMWELWLTPAGVTGNHGPSGSECAQQVEMWPGPQARDRKSGDASRKTAEKNARPLNEIAENWGTPGTADEHEHSDPERAQLKQQAIHWSTPDAPGAGGPRNRQLSIGEGHQTTVAEQAEHFSLPLATPTASGRMCWCGIPGCAQPSHKRRLNSYFDEWLMGLPQGWSSANARIGSDAWETWLFQSRERLRFLFSSIEQA